MKPDFLALMVRENARMMWPAFVAVCLYEVWRKKWSDALKDHAIKRLIMACYMLAISDTEVIVKNFYYGLGAWVR